MSNFERTSIFRLFSLWLLVVTQVGATELPMQKLESIHSQGLGYLRALATERYGAAASATLLAPDSRLRLQQCNQPMTTFMPPGASLLGRTSVGVRCAGPQPWTLYLRGRVSVWRMVAVSSQVLRHNTILSNDHVEFQKRDLGKLTRGYIENREDLVGLAVKRSVAANVALNQSMLRAPIIIERGQIITLVSRSANVEVSVHAKALSDGALGQRIVVENTATRKRLDGIVYAPGVVHTGSSTGLQQN